MLEVFRACQSGGMKLEGFGESEGDVAVGRVLSTWCSFYCKINYLVWGCNVYAAEWTDQCASDNSTQTCM